MFPVLLIARSTGSIAVCELRRTTSLGPKNGPDGEGSRRHRRPAPSKKPPPLPQLGGGAFFAP